MRKTGIILPSLLAAFVLSICNTVKGVGKDSKQGGEAIARAAKSQRMDKFTVLNGIVAPLDRDHRTARAASRARAGC